MNWILSVNYWHLLHQFLVSIVGAERRFVANNALPLTPSLPCPLRVRLAVRAEARLSFTVGPKASLSQRHGFVPITENT